MKKNVENKIRPIDILKKDEFIFDAKIKKPNNVTTDPLIIQSCKSPMSQFYGKTDVCINAGDYERSILQTVDGSNIVLCWGYTVHINGKTEYLTTKNQRVCHVNYYQYFLRERSEYNTKIHFYSERKNDSVIRLHLDEESKNDRSKFGNILDIFYYVRDFSSVTSGYNKTIRNIILLDIDEDVETTEKGQDILKSLLKKFADADALPSFVILNHESHHVQLQWLIQDYKYLVCGDKEMKKNASDYYKKIIKHKSEKDISVYGIKRSEISFYEQGESHKKFVKVMRAIARINNVGDLRSNGLRLKNPITALDESNVYNISLRMPIVVDGEVRYLSNEKMNEILMTEEGRLEYMKAATTFETLRKKFKKIDGYVEMKNDTIIDDEEELKVEEETTDEKKTVKKEIPTVKRNSSGDGRNSWVNSNTADICWKIFKSHNLPKDFVLDENEAHLLKMECSKAVREAYEKEDAKNNGVWDGTTHSEPFTYKEFQKAFGSGYNWACKIYNPTNTSKSKSYNRDASKLTRTTLSCTRKVLTACLISFTKSYNLKMRDRELMLSVNNILKHFNMKEISSIKQIRRFKKEYEDRTELFYNSIKNFYSSYSSNMKELDELIHKSFIDSKNETYVTRKKNKIDSLYIEPVMYWLRLFLLGQEDMGNRFLKKHLHIEQITDPKNSGHL